MTGVQAIVVVTAVLLVHSANCRPLSFPFSQPSDTLGGSRFPSYDIPNPFPNYNQFDYQQYLDDLYGPSAQGRHGARTQARGQGRHGNHQVASSEAFNKLARFGQTILDYLVNRFSNRSSNARSMHAATAPVNRRPAHVQQGVDDIEGILTDILYDELVRDYVDGISPYLNDATEQATKAATKRVRYNIWSYVCMYTMYHEPLVLKTGHSSVLFILWYMFHSVHVWCIESGLPCSTTNLAWVLSTCTCMYTHDGRYNYTCLYIGHLGLCDIWLFTAMGVVVNHVDSIYSYYR